MPDALTTFSDQLAAVVAGASPRLVSVRGADGAVASGIIWRTGLIVSAHEALGGDDEFSVNLPDGTTRQAELVGRDPSTDVALLKVETGVFEDWRQSPTPAVGALAIIGGRGEHSALAALATVSEVGPAWRSLRGGEIDARITLGLRFPRRAEGGAVLAADGGLIGMAVTGPRRRALAIPAPTIGRAVETLSVKGYVPRGYLGVSLHPLGRDAGAIVVAVESDSPAEKAGFLVGDIVTTWGGEPIRSAADIANRLGAGSVGQTVNLGVLRGGSQISLDATIGERPRT